MKLHVCWAVQNVEEESNTPHLVAWGGVRPSLLGCQRCISLPGFILLVHVVLEHLHVFCGVCACASCTLCVGVCVLLLQLNSGSVQKHLSRHLVTTQITLSSEPLCYHWAP